VGVGGRSGLCLHADPRSAQVGASRPPIDSYLPLAYGDSVSVEGNDQWAGSHLTLSIWHPECWTLQVTEDADGGIFGYGVYRVEEAVKGRFTVYGESEPEVEALIDDIEASALTHSVWRLDNRFELDTRVPEPGNTSQSVLVTYSHSRSINDSLVSNGFIPDKAVWIQDGREYWNVIIEESRNGIQERLNALSELVEIIVVTADTHGNAERLLEELPVGLHRIEETEESVQKERVVSEKGIDHTVCVGNGSNDVLMLRACAVGICIVGTEGAFSQAVLAADLLVQSIDDALDLLLKPERMKASLRR